MHPSFRRKHVIKLRCRFCDLCVCRRGMKAVLLADTAVELYSTDSPISGGNVLGYQVVLPCASCLQACNNGHLWIFNSNTVVAESRLDRTATKTLRWDSLPEASSDPEADSEQDEWDVYFQGMECCR